MEGNIVGFMDYGAVWQSTKIYDAERITHSFIELQFKWSLRQKQTTLVSDVPVGSVSNPPNWGG